MDIYILIGPDLYPKCAHDTWQGAAECMSEYDAETQKHMFVAHATLQQDKSK